MADQHLDLAMTGSLRWELQALLERTAVRLWDDEQPVRAEAHALAAELAEVVEAVEVLVDEAGALGEHELALARPRVARLRARVTRLGRG
jgi:hypothetical protein